MKEIVHKQHPAATKTMKIAIKKILITLDGEEFFTTVLTTHVFTKSILCSKVPAFRHIAKVPQGC